MFEITKIHAREILDSRGNPTVEAEVYTKEIMARASVPSGASKGIHESLELRDGGKRYDGKGVFKAVDSVNRIIAPNLLGIEATQQKFIDMMMVNLDNTDNKSKLGANAILAVSMAICRLGAMAKKKPLFRYIQEISETQKIMMPAPYFNVLNGGKHAGNLLDIQEYMIVPHAPSFSEALRMGSDVYQKLKEIIKKKYGQDAVNVGDEGGFAPPLKDNEEPLKLLTAAIKETGYEGKIKLAMDCASSEFYYDGRYLLGKKIATDKEKASLAKRGGWSGERLVEYYLKLIKKYNVFSIEDPFAQDDWVPWQEFMKMIDIQVVGDDLLVTNTDRIKMALEKKACNSLLLKVNQIGTVTEAINAAKLAHGNDWSVIVSHRSGETDDSFIADLAVGLGVGNIKAGAPCRGERIAKYNQLLRIEEGL
jgi:enolase